MVLLELDEIPSEAAKVYLALCNRLQLDTKMGMTLNELSRETGLGPKVVNWCLVRLDFLGWIAYDPPNETITFQGTKIPFTLRDTDDTRIQTLEKELYRLSQTRVEKSGLIDIYRGSDEGDLYAEIENGRGHAIDATEALLLGKMVQKFGPERVKQTYRQMKRSKNPIRATYAALQRGIKGKGAQRVESNPFEKVVIRDIS